MNITNLLRENFIGLIASLILILINNELVIKRIENIFYNSIIYDFYNQITGICTFIGIILAFYFIVNILKIIKDGKLHYKGCCKFNFCNSIYFLNVLSYIEVDSNS